MPVDRELAFEYLKDLEPKVYEIYLGLKHVGINSRDIEKRIDDVHKLILYSDFVLAMDELESDGVLKITNDYGTGEIHVEHSLQR